MASTSRPAALAQDHLVVDCDVHQGWASPDDVAAYLPEHFRERGLTPPGGPGWWNPVARQGLARYDAIPDDGGPPGSSPELLEAQLFDGFGVDYAVLTGPLTNGALAMHPNLHYATAAVAAYNDWLVDAWLERDERYLGSLVVAPGDPDHAVAEIERLGAHDQLVQVFVPGAHEAPYGHRRYWPIYEAAAAADLPVAMHTSSGSRGVAWAPLSGAGVPLSYFEKHVNTPGTVMGQLGSLVAEGVFVEYPDLRWVFLEQRLGWIPDVLWHMDKLWKGLKDAVPWLERPPSEYVREHVFFSTQPMPEPERPEHLVQLFDMIHADETVVFSSDYPHWDNDNPAVTLRALDDDTRRRVLSGNARELYGL